VLAGHVRVERVAGLGDGAAQDAAVACRQRRKTFLPRQRQNKLERLSLHRLMRHFTAVIASLSA
jgi:hypothetical protein